MSPFPHVRISGGDPRSRGRAYGEEARERVRRSRSVDAYKEVFAAYAGWSWEAVREQALAYREPIETFDCRHLEEIRGIAEGSGLDEADVLAINVRTEVMFAAKGRVAAGESRRPGECSAFAVLPERSAAGNTLIGQNWDWLLHAFDTCLVLEVQRDDGPDYVTVVEAGLLAKTGMNSSGIGLVTNALVSDADIGMPGVPYHVALRGILDAETISDALAVLQRGYRSSAANYLIAHREGLAVNVEAAPGRFEHLYLAFSADGVLVHTNHFLAEEFHGIDVGLWLMPDSPFRLERVRRAVAAAPPKLAIETFQGALADHANYPSGVCCHPDPRSAPLDRGATVASVLMDLDTAAMWVADGHPCTTPYRRLDYGAFLGKAPAVARDA